MKERKPPSHRGGKPILTADQRRDRNREYQRQWRVKNRERLRAYFREYAAANSAELSEYRAAYFQENKDRIYAIRRTPESKALAQQWRQQPGRKAKRSADFKRWSSQNKEHLRVKERRRDRDKKRAKDARWRKRHPEKYQASIALAKAAKPELYRQIQTQSSLRRRSRKCSAPVERVSRNRLIIRDGGRCHLCRRPVDRPTFDHLIPVVRGGAYAEWNLMLAHDRCNKSRGVRQILSEETRSAAEAYIAERAVFARI